jgi:hypothetical protein
MATPRDANLRVGPANDHPSLANNYRNGCGKSQHFSLRKRCRHGSFTALPRRGKPVAFLFDKGDAKTGFNDCIASGKDHKLGAREFTKTPACAPATRRIPAAMTIAAPPVMTIWPRQSTARAPISSSSSASTAIGAVVQDTQDED